jgi:hypothetical protein
LAEKRAIYERSEPSSGPSRPVAELRKAQTIAAIRRMIVAGYSNSEMMEQLKISERTLYRRLAEAVDADWLRLKEQDSSDELALQMGILEDRLTASYRRMVAIATSPKTSVRKKIQAEYLAAHCAVAILQVVVAGPMMMRRQTKEIDISHFGEPFDAEEVDIDSADRIRLAEKAQ